MSENMGFEPGWTCHDEHCGSEIVSPILVGYSGIMSVKRQLKHMWTWQKSIEFADCGLHVHVDIQHFTLGNAKRLLLIASRFDQTIYCMMDGPRWNNNYARRCIYDESKIKSAKTLIQLQSLQVNGRYYGSNLYAFSKHGTVEFRYAMGSANWEKIYSLISLYLRMVAVAQSDMEITKVNPVDSFKELDSHLVKPKENLIILRSNRDAFFDMLQLKGAIRESLAAMFDSNVLDTKSRANKSKEDLTENRDKIKFSLKRK